MAKTANVRISESAHMLAAEKAGYFSSTIKDVVSEAIFGFYRWETESEDKLREFEKEASVLPLRLPNDSSAALTEITVATGMSGKVDFVEGLPRELTLVRRLSSGHEFCSRYYNANFIAVRIDQSEREVKTYRRVAFAACAAAAFSFLAGLLL